MAMPRPAARERRPPPPLDAAVLDRLALRYVERFATSRGKLTDYLRRKIRERGWDGAPADPGAVAERMAELGYVDDLSFAEARASAMARRGLGARRVGEALRHAGIEEEEREAVAPAIDARRVETALAFARRKRIGPFAVGTIERATQQKHLAAMLRAGHDFTLSRRIVAAEPGASPEAISDEFGS